MRCRRIIPEGSGPTRTAAVDLPLRRLVRVRWTPADTTRLIPEHEGYEVDVRIQVAHPVNVQIQTVETYRTPGIGDTAWEQRM